MPVAAWVALLSAYTEEVLVAMAYTYLVSPVIEWGVTRALRRPPSPPPAPGAAVRAAADRPAALLSRGAQAFGRRSVTVVPTPGVLVTSIVPAFSSTLRRAMVSPSPVPVALVEK